MTDVYPTEIPKPNGSFFFLDHFEKLSVGDYNPKDCGNGLWKIWDGVYGSKKFAEEVENAMLKEIDEKLSPEN